MKSSTFGRLGRPLPYCVFQEARQHNCKSFFKLEFVRDNNKKRLLQVFFLNKTSAFIYANLTKSVKKWKLNEYLIS